MKSTLSLALGFALLAGCGGIDKFPTAEVTGTVMCNGKPVAYALVFFEPLKVGETAIAGKQAAGLTDADGKFVLTTYDDGDGAVVGKHRVRVGPSANPEFKCDCKTDSEFDVMEVDITADGENTFVLELPKKDRRDRNQVGWDDDDDDDD